MCGIIGCAGREDATLSVLLAGLSNLEYRGYDSAGIALANESLTVVKRAGELDRLTDAIGERALHGVAGIGHTRWSTHGPPTDGNAHPHTDCRDRVAVVHNGIIENDAELRAELEDAGHVLESDTDTEVVPHLIGAALDDGLDEEAAFRVAVGRLEGSYAIAATFAGGDAVYGARRDSPLVLGIGEGATYLASDVPAFLEFTDRVVYLDDGQWVRLAPDGWAVFEADDEVDVEVEAVDWTPEETGKGGYEHYMLKEINEQPRALRDCIRGRVDELSGSITLSDLPDFGWVEDVQFVACGTSYHAALFGVDVCREADLRAFAHLASEYASSPPPIEEATLVVGITQSGETADTLAALRAARARGAHTLAITNVVGSTAARECDDVLPIRAGPEIGVAASKTFSSQLVALSLLVGRVAGTDRERVAALRDLPDAVQAVLDETNAADIAKRYVDADSYFFIGRGRHYPVALEGALKLKELTYRHAEGFAAGELKHGPLALVTERTPVFAIVTGEGERARKTLGNVKEVEARRAPVVAVTDGALEVERFADAVLRIPATPPHTAPVLANVQLQLVAYHTARLLGRSIDKPRNLAKSVTVE